MQIKSAPSTQDVFVLGILLAAILLAAALSARVAPLLSPLVPVPDAPAQSAPAQSLPAAPVERPGRMFDDMPIDPPAHEPGTGTPRYAGE